jgi:hypothetical protein
MIYVSTQRISLVVGGFITLFFSLIGINAYAGESLFFDTHIGFYCTEVQSTRYLSGGHYPLNGFCHAYYTGDQLPAEVTGYYGDLYQKTSATTAILLNGHALGGSTSGTFASSQNETFILGTSSKIYFIAIYNGYSRCVSDHPSQDLRDYLIDNSNPYPPSDCNWGITQWTDLETWTGDWIYNPPPATASTTDPDFGIIGNYFYDLYTWLLKPQQSSFNQFNGLSGIIQTKAPFAYFYLVKTSLSGFNGSSTPAFTLATIGSVNTNIFTPIRTGLTWILWIIFGFWVIRNIRDLNF